MERGIDVAEAAEDQQGRGGASIRNNLSPSKDRGPHMNSAAADTRYWYAVYTKPRQERTAVEHLLNQRFETFLPRIAKPRRIRGQWREVAEPMFPRYCFVRADLRSDNTAPIAATRGVSGLVRFGGEHLPVPTAVIERLRTGQDLDPDRVVRPERLFKPGQEVTVADGPLAGLKAIVEACNSRQRVYLLMELMGKSARVSVNINQLTPT